MSDQTKAQLDGYFKKSGGYKTLLEREPSWSEQMLTGKISDYMRENHPSIPFQVDMSGEKLSNAAAIRSSKNRAGLFKMPDLTIYVKKGKYGCLMLELKKLSAHPLKLNGELKKSEHIELQAHSIKWLREHGQLADFSVGYVETIKKINDYLSKGEIDLTFK